MSQSSANKFHAKSTALEVVEGHDLSGYTILITGGTDGIGKETVKALAKAGAHVIIGARNKDKGNKVANELKKETGNERIEVEWLDLSSLSNVRKFLADFNRPLNVLINNAGILPDQKSYTPDGFESSFGVNHMSHFVLTTGLLSLLKEGAKLKGIKSRVITLSSRAHLRSEIGFEDVNYTGDREYVPLVAYGQSKTANALFAFQLARLHSQDILSYSVHPGLVVTNMLLQMPLEERIKHGLSDKDGKMPEWSKNIEQGASTTVWAVIVDESEAPNGSYLNDCAVAVSKPEENRIEFKDHIYDKEKAEKLWKLSEEWAVNPPKQ